MKHEKCHVEYWRLIVFFFKQKTAYEMRISDWSSDVCSSDLIRWKRDGQRGRHAVDQGRPDEVSSHRVDTVNDPTTPWQILGDIRESLGRLEGKFDAQSERNKTNEQTLEHHDVRLTSLENKHDRLQTVVKMVAWAGSAMMAICHLLGDRILSFLF